MEIRRGTADVILAGGVEILSPFFYEALDRFRALSPADGGVEGTRPFDLARNGPVMGEGCGIVCLEAGELARERGASPYAEVTGWGLASSPSPLTGWPADHRGFVIALERAMRMAGAIPADIDLIQTAANGGYEPDALEAAAYERVFGGGDAKPLITSLKGVTGEIFASGGIRAAALALSVREDVVPPLVGLTTPMCSLPFVIGDACRRPVKKALLGGISFGGTYASLVFEKVTTESP
jgi:3-oxoacyl-[acyl-carrier-protein] synthase II